MSDKNINAYCRICGGGYHICNACTKEKSFLPWRTIADSIEHYKIYMIIHNYTYNKTTKAETKSQLDKCDLTGLEDFLPEIKEKIEEILQETPVLEQQVIM